MNYSIDFLNVGNITLCIEGKLCGTVAIPVIKRTVENYYTHIIHYPLKRYISGYVILKSTVPEAEIQSVM